MKRLPEWRRQAVVRALVQGDLSWQEIADAVGVSRDTVKRVARKALRLAPQASAEEAA